MNTVWLIIAALLALERLSKVLLVRHFFGRSVAPLTAHHRVSILQPILGGDPALQTCLSENLARHAQHEFLWLVDDNDHVALALCRQLMREHPHTNIRLHVMPPPPDGCNPKMFKLIEGIPRATGEYIAVLDDDTALPAGAFEQCLPYLAAPDAGLVFGLPYYVSFDNLWSSLIACFVNSNSLLTYIPYTYLSEPLTINGMFYVLRRETLAALGDLRGLETQLCDDYAVARHVLHNNFKLVQTPLRHTIRTTVTDARHYLSLLTRWLIFPQASIMRTAAWRVQAVFYGFAFLPALFPLLLTLAACWWNTSLVWLFWLAYLALNNALVAWLNRRYLESATPLRKLPLVLLMQILLPLHLLWSLVAPRRINWRGHLMHVQTDGGFRFIARRNGEHERPEPSN
jgi:ceramide glucosyltransferase